MISIIIFTGPIRSGKTTKLTELFSGYPNVGGFLCPDQNGVRHFVDLHNGISEAFEVSGTEEEDNIVTIGQFRFKKSVFEKAKLMLSNFQTFSGRFFIIDEAGKLEMKDEGLEPELSDLIHSLTFLNKDSVLILVVRDSLLDAVIRKYRLEGKVHIVLNDNLVSLDDFNVLSL